MFDVEAQPILDPPLADGEEDHLLTGGEESDNGVDDDGSFATPNSGGQIFFVIF